MKRILILSVLFSVFTLNSTAQVITFSKTLPTRAFSFGLSPVLNGENIYHYFLTEPTHLSGLAFVGYGLTYDVDVKFKFGYYPSKNQEEYFGVDVQYLFRETRQSYFSLIGGAHYWETFGLDGAFTFSYTPQRWLDLSFGIDMNVDFARDMPPAAWLPLHVGINTDDRFYMFLEYDLPATESAWDILSLGVHFIFR